MKKWIWLAIPVVLVMWGIGQYNKIITLDEAATGQWANVESAYQRRADLIPNLVATVKGYAEHERETLEAVVNARSRATSVNINADDLSPEKMAEFQAAQDQLSGALSRLLVVVESYPDLKANQNFLELQSQLEGTENRINVERNRFNETVKTFNAKIRRFPGNIFAGMMGMERKGYFESAPGAEQAPEVEF